MSGFVSTWFSPSPKRALDKVKDGKSGIIFLRVEKNGVVTKNKLFMKVSNEHGAQIFTDEACCYKYGRLSLRNCTVTLTGTKQITIQTDDKDFTNDGFTFEAVSETDALEWIQTLTPTISVSQLSPFVSKRPDCFSSLMSRGVDDED